MSPRRVDRSRPVNSWGWDSRRRGEVARLLPLLYTRSLAHFGALNWWPGETREEVIIGAVLTQNTAWTNVEKALESLRRRNSLTLCAVDEMPLGELAGQVRPAGYFLLKSKRLKAVARWFIEHCGVLGGNRRPSRSTMGRATKARNSRNEIHAALKRVPDGNSGNPPAGDTYRDGPHLTDGVRVRIPSRRRFSEEGLSVDLHPLIGLRGAELETLRQDLLGVYGIGPETADSILLYALEGDTFVVDAYTMRIGERHGLFPLGSSYEEVKLIFEGVLGRDVDWFNDYHAQIVAIGKEYCKTRNPLCDRCPLGTAECFAFGRVRWKSE